MPISFNNFPANWKMPLYWVEVDPSQAGFPRTRQPALLVGHPITGSSAVVDVAIPIGSQAEVRALTGAGSMLDAMVDKFLKSNFAHELWVLPVAEPVSGVKATGTITVSSPPTESGTLYIYVGGHRVAVRVAADDTANEIAGNIVVAVNADPLMPVVASLATTDAIAATLTCKWKGTSGNDIVFMDSYGGSLASETLPVGLALTYSNSKKLSGGTNVTVFGAPADASTGAFGYTLTTGAAARATFASGLPLTFTPDPLLPTGAYTIAVTVGTTTKTADIDVTNGDVGPVSFTFP